MLTFKTQFPLNGKKEVDDLFEIVRTWLAESPDYHVSDSLPDVIDIKNYMTRIFGIRNEDIGFAKFEEKSFKLSAIRLKKHAADSKRWVTEVAFLKTEKEFIASIHRSVDNEMAIEKINYDKRPYILELIMSNIGGGMDGHIPVSGNPVYLQDDQIEFAADILTGNEEYAMPIVYISVDKYNQPFIDPKQISKRLSGMAHVIVEPSREFSFELWHLTDHKNAHEGAVAIHWPIDNSKRFFRPNNEYADKNSMQDAIVKNIHISLLAQRTKKECTWGYLQERISRERIYELEKKGSDDYSKEWIETLENELGNKNEEIEKLKSENDYLQYRNFDSVSSGKTQGIALESTEKDLYQGERLSIIMDVLNQAIESTASNSRRKKVLEDLISYNLQEGERSSMLYSLKNIFKSYVKMNATTRQKLKKFGFSISEEGKHYKLFFRDDPRQKVALSKTISDHKGGENIFSIIKKTLF